MKTFPFLHLSPLLPAALRDEQSVLRNDSTSNGTQTLLNDKGYLRIAQVASGDERGVVDGVRREPVVV